MIDMENVCGNCKYNKYNFTTEEFTCDCEESAYYGLETYYEDSCDAFEDIGTIRVKDSIRIEGDYVITERFNEEYQYTETILERISKIAY